VTSDAAALCLKAGNAVILRGGSEALHSNRAIADGYLVRGPRVFSLLRKTRFVLRGTPAVVAPSTVVVAEAEAA
jgi:hypothetical protein